MGETINDSVVHGLRSLIAASPLALAWEMLLERPFGMDQHPMIFGIPFTVGYILKTKDHHLKLQDVASIYLASAASYHIVNNFIPELYRALF